MRRINKNMNNRIGSQGFVSSPGSGLVIDCLGSNSGYLTQSSDGQIGIITAVTAAITPKYEFYDHYGRQLIPDSSQYATATFNGRNDSYDGGMQTWNTSSSVFRPESLGKCYTIRVTGRTESTGGGGTGVIHFSLGLSGALPPFYVQNENRHSQEIEFQSRNNLSHIHIHCIFPVFTDAQLFASGAQVYMTTTIAGGIQLISASIMIKEG